MSSSRPPCAGCPCSCEACIFGPSVKLSPDMQVLTVVAESDYGCVHGGSVVNTRDGSGLLRGQSFHPLTIKGFAFLAETANPLASQLSPVA